jgi:hypothetical protein
MIARHWRGWTKPQEADAYEALLTDKVPPGLRGIQGYQGGLYFDPTVSRKLNLWS